MPAFNHSLRHPHRRLSDLGNLLLVGAIAVAELPFLAIFFRRLWAAEHHRFFPVILVAFCALLYQRWPSNFASFRLLERLVAWFALLAGYFILLAAIVLWSPWVAFVGVLFTVLFLLIKFAGGGAVSGLFSTWMLLWVLLPLPANVDRQLVLSLQSLASESASKWLDVFGYNHVLSGHVIHIPAQRFVIAEACSGTNSFFVLLSFTAIILVALRYPAIPALLLLASSVFWAVVANILRIVLLVVLRVGYGVDLSSGVGHTLLGLATFGIALGLLFSTDRLLLFLLAPTKLKRAEGGDSVADTSELPVSEAHDDDPHGLNSSAGVPSSQHLHSILGRVTAAIVSVGFLLLAATQLWLFLNAPSSMDLQTVFVGENKTEIEQLGLAVDSKAIQSVPEDWKFVRFTNEKPSNQTAVRSATWTFRRGDTPAIISLDYPFQGWHELPICYSGQGWELSTRRVMTGADRIADEVATLVFDLEKPTGDFGLVMVSLFDRKGERLVPPPTLGWSWERLLENVTSRLTRYGIEADQVLPVYQFQILVTSKSPLTSFERQKIAELYFAARKELVSHLSSPIRRVP